MIKLYVDGQFIGHYEHFDIPSNSVFTTMRSKNGAPLSWTMHWRRLSFSAQFFGYPIPLEEPVYRFIINRLAEEKSEQKIRLIISPSNFALTIEPYLPPPSSIYDGVSVVISSIEVHPELASFKTGNLLPYVLAKKEAESNGAFEGLLLDKNGFIVDGSRTSIMYFDGKTFTALEGGLSGCMREQALAYVIDKGYETRRAHLTPKDIIEGQLLLANSLLGVVPVGSIKSNIIALLVQQFRMDKTNT